MPPSKKIGFFWGDDKITLVEFEKNSPVRIVSSPLGVKANRPATFASELTEEIQIVAILKKMLQDNRITGGAFYVSLPIKEIILRSFVIPYVYPEDLPNAIKFEAKKYLPFDIQDLSYVFHTIPLMEGQHKNLQVIFFAARKEALSRYDRVFTQAEMAFPYAEPYIVSLAKALLFRKEIKPTDHLAFLALDKHFGRICFINNGIPQFIREFTVSSFSQETETPPDDLRLKIINEVNNSFEFYSRQSGGEGVRQMLVLSEFIQKDLLETLEAELKLKVTKFSPAINTGAFGQSNDIDAIYAMGACVAPPVDSLSKFNFTEDKTAKPQSSQLIKALEPYKENIFALFISVFFVVGVYTFFQMQLKFIQWQYNRLTAGEGAFLHQPQDLIQSDILQTVDKLNKYKNIRTDSDLATLIVRLAFHLPRGTMLSDLKVNNNRGDIKDAHLTIDMDGMVMVGDPNAQIAAVKSMCKAFEEDKKLAGYFSKVNLGSLIQQEYDGQQVTEFTVNFS